MGLFVLPLAAGRALGSRKARRGAAGSGEGLGALAMGLLWIAWLAVGYLRLARAMSRPLAELAAPGAPEALSRPDPPGR